MGALRKRSRRRPIFRLALLLAASSKAAALSLANFQIITSDDVSGTCIFAYDSQISGCTTSDFTNGKHCSHECIRGLQATESLVKLFCSHEDAGDMTLLGLTLSGQLVDTLCHDHQSTTITTTIPPSTSTTNNGFTTLTGHSTTATTTTTSSSSSTTRSHTHTTKTSETETTSTTRETTQETTSASSTSTPPPQTTTDSITTTPSISSTPPPATSTGALQTSSSIDESAPAVTNNGSPFLDFPASGGAHRFDKSVLDLLLSGGLIAVLLLQ